MKKIYLILSAIFLFNPIISIIDVFPDCIGYLFLLKAFSKLSYIDDVADDLCNSLKKMSLITAIKLACLFIIPSLDQTMYLVFSFVFAILELIFGVPLFIKMFDMFSNMALMDVNNASLSDASSPKALSYANNEKIKAFTLTALAAKLSLACLPDFTLLSISNGVDTQTGINFAQFRPLLFAISAFISLSFGIVWLIKIIRYYNGLLTNTILKKLNNSFVEMAKGRKSLFMAKDSMFFILLLCIGSLFALDFNLNLVNVFWDSIFSVVITLAFVYLIAKKHFNSYLLFTPIAVLSAMHLASDICLTIYATKFFDRYNLDSILKVSDAEDMYFEFIKYAIISAILFVLVVIFAYLVIRKNAEKALRENAFKFAGIDTENCISEFKKSTTKSLVLISIFSALSSIAYACYMLFRHSVYVLTVVNSAFEIAFIIVFIKAMLYLYDNVYKRIYEHS